MYPTSDRLVTKMAQKACIYAIIFEQSFKDSLRNISE